MRTFALGGAGIALTVILISHGGALAQTAQAGGTQVEGPELQRWLDADGLALGGFDLRRSCQFMAKSSSAVRHVTVICPGQSAPWTVKGEGKVVGNSWCVKFTYPDGSADDHCEEFFKIGENRYEIRLKGVAVNRVYRLIP